MPLQCSINYISRRINVLGRLIGQFACEMDERLVWLEPRENS